MKLVCNGLDRCDINELFEVEQACHSHPWTKKTLSSCIGGRYFNVSVEHQGKLVGYFIAEQAGPDITLMNICILPQLRGQGLAKQLMQALLDECARLSAENLFLEVRVSNKAAITLYREFKLAEIGVRKNYYPSGSGREDALLMGLSMAEAL